MAKKKLYIAAIFTVVILLAVLVPQNKALAGGCAPIPGWFDTTDCIKEILNVPFYVIGWLLSFVAGLLSDFIKASVVIIPAVRESWTILRDFVNMLFILVLIIMAFGTIFDIQKYTWKRMLAPFLIAALLINFSFVIGEYIISIGNGLSSVFLNMIGTTNLKDRIGEGLGLQKMIANSGENISGDPIVAISSVVGAGIQYIITEGFFIVFGAIALLAMIAAFIFVFIRIPILWMFLIVSPIAWFGYTLPNLRAQTWSAWWHHFLQWVFFLPVYLFFLMFSFIFIAAKSSTQQLAKSATLGSNALLVVNDIAFYIITLIFLVGGLWASFKVGGVAGSGAAKLMGGIEKRVKKYMPGAAYARGAWGGLKARGEEIKEKGVLSIGGEQRAREAEARARGWIAGIPGLGRVPGAREARERAEMTEIDKEVKRIREQLERKPANKQREFLEEQKAKGGLVSQAAELEFVKQGYSKLEDYQKAVKRYGGENSAFMRQYLENIKQAKLSDLFKSPDEELRIARGQVEDTVGLVNLRRELYKDLAKRDRVNNLDDYNQAKKLLSPIPAELRSFLDSVKAEAIFTSKEKRQEALLDSENKVGDADLEKKLVEFMQEKKEIADYKNKETQELIASGWQLREEALKVLGGKKTFGGEALVKQLNSYNPVINIEADMRMEQAEKLGLDFNKKEDKEKIQKLILDNEELIKKVQVELKNKSFEDVRKMSSAFFKDPVTQEAIAGYDRSQEDIERKLQEGRERELKRMYDPLEIRDMLRGASQEMRRALKDFAAPERRRGRRGI